MVQLVYSLLLAFQWRLWSKCMPYGFDHFKKTWSVLLQARFWAEGKHYVILKTTSQGSGGRGRQVLLFSQLYRWQLKALRGWVACLRFMIRKGASCWDVDPGLPHSKSVCLITTPKCLSAYHLLQPLLEDLAYDSQLCLFHKDAQAAKWVVAKNSSQCRASQQQDWAYALSVRGEVQELCSALQKGQLWHRSLFWEEENYGDWELSNRGWHLQAMGFLQDDWVLLLGWSHSLEKVLYCRPGGHSPACHGSGDWLQFGIQLGES